MGLYQSGSTWVCISKVVHGFVSVRWYMGLYQLGGT